MINAHTRVAVSTLSTVERRYRFTVGGMSVVEDQFKREGLRIVKPSDADLIVVPDSVEVLPTPRHIRYSEFMEMDRPEKKEKARRSRLPKDKVHDGKTWDRKYVIEQLEAGDVAPQETEKNVEWSVSEALDSILGSEEDRELVIKYAHAPEHTQLHPQYYGKVHGRMLKIAQDFSRVVRYFVDLEAKYRQAFPELRVPEVRDRSSWYNLVSLFSRAKQDMVDDVSIVKNMNEVDRREHLAYVVDTVAYSHSVYDQMMQGAKNANVFVKNWVFHVRDQFNAHREGHQCDKRACSGLCYMSGDACRDKPLLMVMDDLTVAFCWPTVREEDKSGRRELHRVLVRLYKNWYGEAPKSTGKDVCDDIQFMSREILDTLRETLGLSRHEHVYWSDLPNVMDMTNERWKRLLSEHAADRAPSMEALKRTVHSESYKRHLKSLLVHVLGSE